MPRDLGKETQHRSSPEKRKVKPQRDATSQNGCHQQVNHQVLTRRRPEPSGIAGGSADGAAPGENSVDLLRTLRWNGLMTQRSHSARVFTKAAPVPIGRGGVSALWCVCPTECYSATKGTEPCHWQRDGGTREDGAK